MAKEELSPQPLPDNVPEVGPYTPPPVDPSTADALLQYQQLAEQLRDGEVSVTEVVTIATQIGQEEINVND